MAHPTPSTWTLRLKSHRTTILLHIDPLTPFAKIKSTLYTALLETGLQATSNGPTIALPSSPEEIKLGRPIDALDASQGFEMGEWEDDSAVSFSDGDGEGVGGDEGKVKGKGKGKAKGGGGRWVVGMSRIVPRARG
ncbi:hypothetical protein EKO04_011487 [Ascochyta lentis]|uniref:Uncharacterized protein n=1 Tax=Ascochyta lentis TaxID=205686 RepID=A0A8H7IWK2_9PLEO|nr:hypothetical protein EKO04_011487 [Ascochyta lentis]